MATDYWGDALGFQQIAVTDTAGGLTVPAGASVAVFSVDTNNVRWRDDGSDPTATVGIPQKTTDAPFVYRGNLAAIKFIEETGAPVLNVSYYGNNT